MVLSPSRTVVLIYTLVVAITALIPKGTLVECLVNCKGNVAFVEPVACSIINDLIGDRCLSSIQMNRRLILVTSGRSVGFWARTWAGAAATSCRQRV